MLAVCVAQGWPTDNYHDPAHPLQQWIIDLIAEYSGVDRNAIPTTIDGCSLPTYYLPISGVSTALARFMARAVSGDEASGRILAALAAHPEMIYERGGFDSELIRVMGGQGIAKRGAMAIFAVGVLSPVYGPIGVTVKMEDGNITPIAPVVMRILEQLGVLSAQQLDELARFRRVDLDNCRNIRVGEIIADFDLAPAAAAV
jgi:L-asparaginase II